HPNVTISLRSSILGVLHNRHEDAFNSVLWSDLRTMFDPPLNEDAIWSLPLQQKMIGNIHCQNMRCLPSDAENEASRWKNE
ncbi:hypothetical protein Tco_0632648, partial [Tanacetum coccineum]